VIGLKFQVYSFFALQIGKDREGLICLFFDVESSIYLSVLRNSHHTLLTRNRGEVLCERCRFFSGLDVDMLQLKKEKKKREKKKRKETVVFCMLLHMCSIWGCHRNLLSEMRTS